MSPVAQMSSSMPVRLYVSMLVVLALGAAVLGGCTSVRNDLGTNDSGCYIAIPAATAAVHDDGHLEGVRLVGVASLRSFAPALYEAATSVPGPRIESVCLVAFTGRFDAAAVSKPVGRNKGKLAVVELEYPDNRLLATLVVARPSVRFGHSHIGIL
jgi:hypothetical protein